MSAAGSRLFRDFSADCRGRRMPPGFACDVIFAQIDQTLDMMRRAILYCALVSFFRPAMKTAPTDRLTHRIATGAGAAFDFGHGPNL